MISNFQAPFRIGRYVTHIFSAKLICPTRTISLVIRRRRRFQQLYSSLIPEIVPSVISRRKIREADGA